MRFGMVAQHLQFWSCLGSLRAQVTKQEDGAIADLRKIAVQERQHLCRDGLVLLNEKLTRCRCFLKARVRIADNGNRLTQRPALVGFLGISSWRDTAFVPCRRV